MPSTKPNPQLQLRMMDWSRLYASLIWVYDGKPGISHHEWPEPNCIIGWLLHSGAVRVESKRSGIAEAHAGQWIFPPTDKLRHDFSDDAKILSVRFHAKWPSDEQLFIHDKAVVFNQADTPELNKSARALLRGAGRIFRGVSTFDYGMLWHEITSHQHTQLQRAVWQWVDSYCSAMMQLGVSPARVGNTDPRVAVAQTALNNYPVDQPLDENLLARQAGLSVSQLNRLFVSQVGSTVRAVFQRRRLEFARTALLSQQLPVKQVAYLLGFKHVSHFCQWFAGKTHSTPGAYRRNDMAINQLVE